jgi:tetratricopeptide (TPR) repeat protein
MLRSYQLSCTRGVPFRLWGGCAAAAGLLFFALGIFSPVARGQMIGQPRTSSPNGEVDVRIVSRDGRPIDLPARVTLEPEGDMASMQQVTSDNGSARFYHVPTGRYGVQVSMPGFKEGEADEVDVMSFGTVEASVTMQPEEDASTAVGAKGMVLMPKAKKELDDGIAALRARKDSDAEQHLQAAYKLAPGNPDVNAALGEYYLVTKNYDKCQEYLQRAASLDPENVAALVDMGQLRIEQSNFPAAVTPLEKAVGLAPRSVLAHWLLGVAYFDMKENEKARVEAAAAIKASKGTATEAEYLLGQALAALGRNAEAIVALQAFVHDMPQDRYAQNAQDMIAKLQAAPAVPAAGGNEGSGEEAPR